jgi:cell wall-associated NlpC family hydrolase
MQRLFILLILTSLVWGDYILKPSRRYESRIDYLPKNKVADMYKIPQNPAYYAKQIVPYSKFETYRNFKRFKKLYFIPWELDSLDIPSSDFGWEVRFVTKKKIYASSGRVIPSYIYKKWIANENMDKLDSVGAYGITIRRTNVKAFPISKPFYLNPKKPGEGFPFDYNQNSALHINVPLYISHYSKDHKWAFVRASYSFGWVKVQDIALVDRDFMRKFQIGVYAMSIKDNLRLYDEKKHPVSLIKLGALFPYNMVKNCYFVAIKGYRGKAKLKRVKPTQKGIIAKIPLPFTPANVAKVAKEFYNEPYGWGGGYECRDCSATTRDFMGVFGVFLHRNSSKQAKDGEQIYIKGLAKKAKKRAIIKNAKPFRSLLYVPGHIVLYLGEYRGEPVIMHTYWGIRKKNGSKLVTARTIITSTEPGKERKDIKEKSKLINTLKYIVNF